MPRNKNQHFVPKFYLRNFAQANQRQIAVFHLQSRRHVLGASLRHQCARDHFYGADDAIDSRLRALERRSSLAIASVIKNTTPPSFGGAAHRDLLEFILAQRARTPAAIAAEDALLTQLRYHAPVPATHPAYDTRSRLEHALRRAEQGRAFLEDLGLKVLFNTSDVEFVMSDAPVVFQNILCHDVPFCGTLGYTCAGLTILVPVSPRHMLLFFDPSVYRVGDLKTRVIHVSSSSVAAHLNSQQLNVATEALYYSGAPTTRDAIDCMPVAQRRPRHEMATSVISRDIGGNSSMVHLYEQLPIIPLDVDFISVKPYYRRLSAVTRSQMTRPLARSITSASA
jgi:hypothetical protein